MDEGEEVTFKLDFTEDALDPEKDYTITVTSNVSGLLLTSDAEEEIAFDTGRLPLGPRTITITLSDGTNEVSTTLNITVNRASMKTDSPGMGVAIAISALVATMIAIVAARKRSLY